MPSSNRLALLALALAGSLASLACGARSPDRPVRPPLALANPSPTAADCIHAYLHALATEDRAELEWAERELGRTGTEAVEPLGELIVRWLRKDPALSVNALTVFQKYVPPDGALPRILAALRAKNGRVREFAVKALAEAHPTDRVLEGLVGSVADHDSHVALAAVHALRQLDAQKGYEELGAAYPSRVHASSAIRIAVLDALGTGLPSGQAHRLLLPIVRSGEPDLALAAAGALLSGGSKAGVDALTKRFGRKGPKDYGPVMQKLLARAGDPTVLDDLVHMAASSRLADQRVAAKLLGHYSSARAEKALDGLLRSPVLDIRREALDSLSGGGRRKALRRALAMLGSRDAKDRLAAALVLGRWKEASTAGPLARALDSERVPGVRLKLVSAIALVGNPAGAAAVARALRSETVRRPSDASLAWNAATALIELPPIPDDALRILEEAARSSNPAVRFHAARALGVQARGRKAERALTALLRDPSAAVRVSAARAWGRYRHATLPPLLSAYRHEEDDRVAKAMAVAAHRIVFRWPGP